MDQNRFLTDREFACLVWNTMYAHTRRPFKDISESAKIEWEDWARIARAVAKIDDRPYTKDIKDILEDKL